MTGPEIAQLVSAGVALLGAAAAYLHSKATRAQLGRHVQAAEQGRCSHDES